jgi:hypothetical protein
VLLINALIAINFCFRTDFAVDKVVFSFSLNFGVFCVPPYFFCDPLIIEQCVVQPPNVPIVSAAAFVVEFLFYSIVIR